MNSKPQLSQSSVLFIAKFKKFLDSTGLSLDQFFQNFQTINRNEISRLEYFRIISLVHIQTYDNFNPHQVFNQLSNGTQTIQKTTIKVLMDKIGAIINEKKQGQQKALQEEMKKKVVRIGLHKLQQFISKHPSPIVFFYEFDTDQNGSISKVQFGKLLCSTDIKEFQSRDIRKMLADHLFSYFPKGQMTVKQLADFFKIKYETGLERRAHFPNKAPSQDDANFFNNKSPQKQPQKHNHSLEVPKHPKGHDHHQQNKPFGKKQQNPYIVPTYPQVKKEDESKNFQNHISNIYSIYPNSMRYYSQGEPQPFEYQVLQELQMLLTKNGKYNDKENPRISHNQGTYIPAEKIFTTKFYIFQMANSVLMREKSRIGVAQQIEPKDIIQGSIGDCYFLSSIASIISIYPEMIAGSFILNINPANMYAVKLFIDGEWKVITTDDKFPCDQWNRPKFAKPHHQEIWVMLLQKCWAKVFGSYKAIQAGSSKQGFMALTGAPCEVVSLQKADEIKEGIRQLQIAQKHRYVATMSGSDYLEKLGKEGEEKLGLISGHAYSLLKIINIQGQTLLKLRNPWGKTIWKGQWSFNSSRWTNALRDKYNYHRNPEDGAFYIKLQDFRKYFGQVIICKLNPTYMHDSIKVKSGRHKSAYLSMQVTTPGQYIVSIYQENKRKMLLKYSNYTYSEARIIVLKKQGNKMRYISSKSTAQSQVCSADMELQEGEYIISAKVVWKFWQANEFTLTSYGTDHTTLTPIDRSIAPAFKENMIKTYAKMYEGTGKVKSYQKYGFDASCQTNFNLERGIGFVRMVNNSAKGFDSIQQYECKGIKVIKPDRFPLQFKMGPKSQKVYGLFISPGGFEYSNTEKIKY